MTLIIQFLGYLQLPLDSFYSQILFISFRSGGVDGKLRPCSPNLYILSYPL